MNVRNVMRSFIKKTLICCKHALADHHKLWAGGIMFGYIVMNKPEIKFKDFDLYRSFYCGLCRELKSKYGISGQISLTYDMTFCGDSSQCAL